MKKSCVIILNMTKMDELKDMLTCLTNEFKAHRAEMQASIKNFEDKLVGLTSRVSANEKDLQNYIEKTDTITVDVLANKNTIADLSDSIGMLKAENEKLAKGLDEQIDRNMRETVIVGGVTGSEKSWEETKAKLAETLYSLETKKVNAAEERYNYNDFYYGIVRAHRGGKGNHAKQIYAKFGSQQMVEHVKSLSFVNKDIFINQMRSPMISERLFNGRKHIETLKGLTDSKQWKMYMNDRCQLMIIRTTPYR